MTIDHYRMAAAFGEEHVMLWDSDLVQRLVASAGVVCEAGRRVIRSGL